MNDTVIKFLQKNGVDPNLIDDMKYRVKSKAEINPILNLFHIPGKRIKKEISIANILGYDWESNNLSWNLIDNLSRYFDADGSTYETRSIGMLDMDRDKCVETLKDVSTRDTVYVRECETNKYVITTNGMHRYHVLRFHYLNELSKIDKNDKDQIKKLKEKYTIQVESQETDYLKTYSYFILRKIIPGIRLSLEYDSNYKPTGKSIIIADDKEKVFSDEDLLSVLKLLISTNRDLLDRYKDSLEFYIENIPSFKNFLDQNNIYLFSKEVSV